MIDLNYLNTNVGSNKAAVNQILELFLHQLPDFIKNIKAFYENNEFENIIELAHKTKNSFQMIGANNQAETLKTIENLASKHEHTEQLTNLIAKILKDSDLIAIELENHIAQ